MRDHTPITNSLINDGVSTDKSEVKNVSVEVSSTSDESSNGGHELKVVPLSFKLASILLVSAIGFGSSWSSGITGAMKTTLKKVHQPPRPHKDDKIRASN